MKFRTLTSNNPIQLAVEEIALSSCILFEKIEFTKSRNFRFLATGAQGVHFTPNLFRFSEPMQNSPSGGGHQCGVGAKKSEKIGLKVKLLGILLNKTLESLRRVPT